MTEATASVVATEIVIPVFSNNNGRGWPRHEKGMQARYMPAAQALSKRFSNDAHSAGYSVPSMPRRLAEAAAIEQLQTLGVPGVTMVAFIGDADGPCHGVPKGDWTPEHVERQDAWFAGERVKLVELEAAHPGAFVYRTKGGYRLMFALARPFVLAGPDDPKVWTLFYYRTMAYLARRFGIVLDAGCGDWTRLFRLPFVTRDDETQVPETIGDPAKLGALDFEPNADELGADIDIAKQIASVESSWLRIYRRLAPPDVVPPPRSRNVPQSLPSNAKRGRPSLEERQRAYARAGLRVSCEELSTMPPGSGRNIVLNAKAFAMGRYVGGGLLEQLDVERDLRDAARACGLEHGEIEKSICSGIEAGIRSPRRPELSEEDLPFVEAPAADLQEEAVGPANDEVAPPPESAHHLTDWLDARVDVDGEDARPIIEITDNTHEAIRATAAALAADRRINLYIRDGNLVKIVLSDSTNDARRDVGLPLCRWVHPAALLEYLTLTGIFVKYDGRKKDLARCLPTPALISGVFHRGSWPGMRPLIGVIETPFLRSDGTVAQVPGYDERTGYLLFTHEAFDPVAEVPTLEDARGALAALADLFCDFPFARGDQPSEGQTRDLSKDIDKSVALAAILTLLARPAIGSGNTPAFLFSANNRGTGKTLIADVVCVIATGRVAPKTGYPTEHEEMEKTLGSVALEACSVLSFDNVNTRFGGGAIDLTLTCGGSKRFRILGASEMKLCTWRTVVMATGNNISVRDDTGRRALICKQDTPLERPEMRDPKTFKHPKLRDYVAEHRRELVAKALTVLRAHSVAGHPPAGVKPLGSFEEWSKFVASAIVWAGGADPTLAIGESETGDDPTKAALAALFEHWPRLYPLSSGGIKAGEAVAKLYPSRKAGEPPPDEDLNDLREAVEVLCPKKGGQVEARALGDMLRKYKDRVVGGHRLTARSAMGGVNRWSVVPTKGVSMSGSAGSEGSDSAQDGEMPIFSSDDCSLSQNKKIDSFRSMAGNDQPDQVDPLSSPQQAIPCWYCGAWRDPDRTCDSCGRDSAEEAPTG